MEQINSTPNSEDMGITQNPDAKNDFKITGTLELIKWSLRLFKSKQKNLLPLIGVNIATAFLYLLLSIVFSGPLSFIVMPIFFIATSIVQLATAYALAKTVLSDENLYWKDALVLGFKKIPSYLWVSILLGFITIGGYVLFILPGIYFVVVLGLTQFAFIDKDMKGLSALSYSRYLTSGFFWPILGRGLLMMLLLFVLILLGSALSFVLSWPFGLFMPKIAMGIGQLINMVIATAGGVIFAISLSKIYKELASHKGDNFDNNQKPIFKMALVAGLGWLIIPLIALGFIASMSTIFGGDVERQKFFYNMMRNGMMNNQMMQQKMMQGAGGADEFPTEEEFLNEKGEFDEAKFNQFIDKYIQDANLQ